MFLRTCEYEACILLISNNGMIASEILEKTCTYFWGFCINVFIFCIAIQAFLVVPDNTLKMLLRTFYLNLYVC